MTGWTDEAFIAKAKELYADPSDDDILIQQLSPATDSALEVVDRLDDGGAWVMAWVFVHADEMTS